jgi:hypothetical protein
MEYKVVMAGNNFLYIEDESLYGIKLLGYLGNESIKNGWEPLGGIGFDGNAYIQGMVIKEKK